MQGLEILITRFRFWYSVGIQKLPNRFVYISATHCFFRNIWEKQKQIDIFLWKRLFLFVTWTYVAHSGQQEIVQLYGLTTSVWVLTSKYDVLFKIIFEIKINFRYNYIFTFLGAYQLRGSKIFLINIHSFTSHKVIGYMKGLEICISDFRFYYSVGT